MFISEFLSDANFGLAWFTLHVYSMINYNDKIDHFTNSDRDRLIGLRLSYDNFSDGTKDKILLEYLS